MADNGERLGVVVGDLWLCARSYLPMVADAFLSANATTADTAAGDGAFTRYGTISGVGIEASVPGPVYPAWVAARDELQRAMGQTARNTYAACDALVRVADRYAATEAAAAAAYRRVIQEYERDSRTLHPGDPNYFRIEDPDQRPTARMPGVTHG